MQVKVHIEFEQLLDLIKSLPESELTILRQEIDKNNYCMTDKDNLRSFLLSGPVFSESQIDSISQTRTAINQWRTK